MLRRMCVIGGAHGAIDWLSGCCYGRLNCSAIGQALYQLQVPAGCQHLCIIIATDMKQSGRWRTVSMLLLLLIQTAEEETVCFSLSAFFCVRWWKGSAGLDLVLNSLMPRRAHARAHIHEFTLHQPVNPPPKDDYYLLFGWNSIKNKLAFTRGL